MKNSDDGEEESDCCACPTDATQSAWSGGCAGKQNVFTKREEAVLDRIREVSMQARALKERIRDCDAIAGDSTEEARSELERLRRVRGELEQERIAAAEERMRLLGHA